MLGLPGVAQGMVCWARGIGGESASGLGPDGGPARAAGGGRGVGGRGGRRTCSRITSGATCERRRTRAHQRRYDARGCPMRAFRPPRTAPSKGARAIGRNSNIGVLPVREHRFCKNRPFDLDEGLVWRGPVTAQIPLVPNQSAFLPGEMHVSFMIQSR